jgi:hypothetical protein
VLAITRPIVGTDTDDAARRAPRLTDRLGTIRPVPGEQLPSGFPYELDDAALAETLAWMMREDQWPGFYGDSFQRLRPELKLALLASGFRERERRSEANETRFSLRLAQYTLAVSIVALIASVSLPLVLR